MTWIARTVAAILIAGVSCSAQNAASDRSDKAVLWSPPAINWPDTLPQPTVPREMIGSLRVADFPVILEQTALASAQKHFGGTIGQRGDAGDFEAWLCLHGTDADGSWIFWLTSGEIDGPAIGGFQWRRLGSKEIPDRRCRLLRGGKAEIALPLAIHPGMTETEARRVLGPATFARGRCLFFIHEHQEVIQNLPYTSDNSLAVVIQDGVVLSVSASKTTTN